MTQPIEYIGARVMKDLIWAHQHKDSYYLSDRMGYSIDNEEDSLFITDDQIINHVKKMLDDKYTLQVYPVERLFESSIEGVEDFKYIDTEIRIVLKENDHEK